MASWVELRVHGVSGTPPEDMLAAPVVTQVGGDGLGRFFRPASGAGDPLPPEETGGHVLEAYHWGLFTSGSFTKGLWFLLLPFGMVNAASFMLPAAGPRWARAGARAVLRVLGLALTAVFVLGAVQVLLDALAWRGPAHGNHWAVGLAMGGCVALLVLVTMLGQAQVPPPPPGQHGALDQPDDVGLRARSGLAREDFFTRAPEAPLLRRLHAAAGVLVVAVPFAAMRAPHDGDAMLWTVSGLLVATAVVVTVLRNPRQEVARFRPSAASKVLKVAPLGWEIATWAALALAVAALGVAAGLALHDLPVPGIALPGLAGLSFALVLVGLAALLLLLFFVAIGAVAGWTTSEEGTEGVPGPFRPYVFGAVSWVVAALGTFLGLGFAVGVGYAASWLLARRGQRVPVPEVSERVAYSWGIAGLAMLALALVAVVVRIVVHGGIARRVHAAYHPGEPQATGDPLVEAPAAAATWTGSFKHWVGVVAGVFAGLGLVLCAAIALELRLTAPDGALPVFLRWTATPTGSRTFGWDVLSEPASGSAGWLVVAGTVLLILFAGGLLLAGREALLKPSIRRGVNVIWDVIAFWPSEAHPIVPPPYSQRAVRDVADRITWLLTTGQADRVLLAGHSQGSLIAAAAVLRVPGDLHARLGLLTHGSQLQFAYPRAFPGYLNPYLLRWILARLDDRWINLFRDTDPFGGPVLSWDRSPDDEERESDRLTRAGTEHGADTTDRNGLRRCGNDWRLLDPPVVDAQDETWPGTRKHGDYYLDAAWPEVARTFWPVEQPIPGPPPSIPRQERDGETPEELGQRDATGGGHDAGAGEEVSPGPGR